MNLTTSKNISLKFTLYTLGIVFFFGLGVNITFFRQRYGSEMRALQIAPKNIPNMLGNNSMTNENTTQTHFGRRQQFQKPMIDEISYSQEVWDELQDSTSFLVSNIASIEDQDVLFVRVNDTIRISNITRMIDAQRSMIITFFFLLLIFAFLTYILSIFFVKTSLRHVHQLVEYVKNLDINTLHQPVPLSGPENDEIHIIGAALQKTLTTIKEQTDSLKDFVTHASHELKTPLMSLSSVIDVANKTKNYEKSYPSAKKILSDINRLFETLLSLTKWEYHKIQKKSLDIIPLVTSISEEILEKYKDKKISFVSKIPSSYTLKTNQDIFHIILFNLVENAFKYTTDKGNVSVTITEHTISVNNSGPGISPEEGKMIRQKFWKNHSHGQKEGFGLGLYLVKLLVEKHNWSIDMTSDADHGTTFTIYLT